MGYSWSSALEDAGAFLESNLKGCPGLVLGKGGKGTADLGDFLDGCGVDDATDHHDL